MLLTRGMSITVVILDGHGALFYRCALRAWKKFPRPSSRLLIYAEVHISVIDDLGGQLNVCILTVSIAACLLSLVAGYSVAVQTVLESEVIIAVADSKCGFYYHGVVHRHPKLTCG